ncbi:hypothetical protein [Parabacteroides merdae]|uniref:hypothetical protein n=1 Tax=Parabacteroides merdae TaxID=46503 RepID=UPI001F044668|nr:hypothetical protein [Parabacteroides merdae]
MMKRINVSGDIESRRRIAGRHVPSAAQPTIIAGQDETGKENGTDKDGEADSAPKARRRKAGGNP